MIGWGCGGDITNLLWAIRDFIKDTETGAWIIRKDQTCEKLETVLDFVDGKEGHFNWGLNDRKKSARQIAEGKEFLEEVTAYTKVLKLEFLEEFLVYTQGREGREDCHEMRPDLTSSFQNRLL